MPVLIERLIYMTPLTSLFTLINIYYLSVIAYLFCYDEESRFLQRD